MKQEDAMILPGDTASGAQGPGSPSWEEDHAPADKDLSPGANEGRGDFKGKQPASTGTLSYYNPSPNFLQQIYFLNGAVEKLTVAARIAKRSPRRDPPPPWPRLWPALLLLQLTPAPTRLI